MLPKSNINLQIKLYQVDVEFEKLLNRPINILDSTYYNNNNTICSWAK